MDEKEKLSAKRKAGWALALGLVLLAGVYEWNPMGYEQWEGENKLSRIVGRIVDDVVESVSNFVGNIFGDQEALPISTDQQAGAAGGGGGGGGGESGTVDEGTPEGDEEVEDGEEDDEEGGEGGDEEYLWDPGLELDNFIAPSPWDSVITILGESRFSTDLVGNSYGGAYISAPMWNYGGEIEGMEYSFECYDSGDLAYSTSCRGSGTSHKGVTVIDSYFQCTPNTNCIMDRPIGEQYGWSNSCTIDGLGTNTRAWVTIGFDWSSSPNAEPHVLDCSVQVYSTANASIGAAKAFHITFT